MEDSGAFDWQVRDAVYAHIVAEGQPPEFTAVARQLAISPETAQAAYERLHARHALFLNPGSHDIRMAHPFSGVPTIFRVTIGERTYWANCAWDALGIPAALQSDARIDAETGDTQKPLQIAIDDARLQGWDGVIHFPLPFRHWYDDLIHT